MKIRHPEAVDIMFVEVLPSGNSFKFILDNNKPPQGWSIYQLSVNSEVSICYYNINCFIVCIHILCSLSISSLINL